jgi:hypothetical protein
LCHSGSAGSGPSGPCIGRISAPPAIASLRRLAENV